MHLDAINFTLYYESKRIIDNRGTLMLNKNEFTNKVRTVFLAKIDQLNKVNKVKSQYLRDSLNCAPQKGNEESQFIYNLGYTQVFSRTEYYLHLLDHFGQLGERYFTEEEIDTILGEHNDIVKYFLKAPTCSELFTFNCGLRYGDTVDHRIKITHKINKQFSDENESYQSLENSIFTLFQPATEVVDATVPQVIVSEMKL